MTSLTQVPLYDFDPKCTKQLARVQPMSYSRLNLKQADVYKTYGDGSRPSIIRKIRYGWICKGKLFANDVSLGERTVGCRC